MGDRTNMYDIQSTPTPSERVKENLNEIIKKPTNEGKESQDLSEIVHEEK